MVRLYRPYKVAVAHYARQVLLHLFLSSSYLSLCFYLSTAAFLSQQNFSLCFFFFGYIACVFISTLSPNIQTEKAFVVL